jgi:hypothetical protein
MTIKQGKLSGAPARGPDPQKYRDRPADEGKHGDGAEEPNSGVPTSPQDAPGRPKRASSRQRPYANQLTQTSAPELASQQARHTRKRG